MKPKTRGNAHAMKTYALAAVAAGALAWSAGLHAQVLRTRFALELQAGAPYYAITLPDAAYAASRRGDLGDLRVYNGAGEPVPYSLDAVQPNATPPVPEIKPVRWFALPAQNGSTGTAGAPMNVTIAPDGSLRAASQPSPAGGRSGDVVDLSGLDSGVQALAIHVRNTSYQGRVRVQSSDDLRSWNDVTQVSLLKVGEGANTLAQERVDLDGLHARYLRLRWPDGAPDIDHINAELAPQGAAPVQERQWRSDISARPATAKGEYLFDTGGAYPIDRIQFGLPQPNTVARAQVYSRNDEQASWRLVASSQLFRLQGGPAAAGGTTPDEQRSPPLELMPDTDRHWRVVVDTRSGGLGSGNPAVAVGWRPATLTFVARGAPPFSLAAGNPAVQSAAVSRDELLVTTSTTVGNARLGAPMAALQQVQAPVTDSDANRRYVLWGALLVAVAALGFMAFRLLRSPPTTGSPED
jgi:hypothetical protein